MPEQGQIWKEKGTKGSKCYVTYVLDKNETSKKKLAFGKVYALYPDGYVHCWSIDGFKHNHEFTGDHVPFEDVAAILF